MFKATIYGKEIRAKTFNSLKSQASRIANERFNVLDTMKVSCYHEDELLWQNSLYIRHNKISPNNTIIRGRWM